MSVEHDLLNCVRTKGAYARYKKFLRKIDLEKLTKTIFNALESWYYDREEEKVDSWEEFGKWLLQIYDTGGTKEERTLLSRYIDALERSEGPKDDVLQELLDRHYGEELVGIGMLLAEGDRRAKMEDAHKLLRSHREESIKRTRAEKDLDFDDSDFGKIIDDVVEREAYKFRLDGLNKATGGIRPGDFIVVGARPDVGKTTFLAHETVNFAMSSDPSRCILWLNNEENSANVRIRIAQSALKSTLDELRQDREGNMEQYHDVIKGPGRIKVRPIHGMSVMEVDALIAEYEPCMIVFDQLSKIGGFDSEGNGAERLAKLFAHGRYWAQRYEAPVMTSIWADATAHNQLYVSDSQLHGSKVGAVGEADAIITLGRNMDDPTQAHLRGVYVPKNKLPGEDPAYRNIQFMVSLDAERAQFIEKEVRHC